MPEKRKKEALPRGECLSFASSDQNLSGVFYLLARAA